MMIMLGALKMKVSIKDAKFCSFYQSQDMDLCFKEVFETYFSFFNTWSSSALPKRLSTNCCSSGKLKIFVSLM